MLALIARHQLENDGSIGQRSLRGEKSSPRGPPSQLKKELEFTNPITGFGKIEGRRVRRMIQQLLKPKQRLELLAPPGITSKHLNRVDVLSRLSAQRDFLENQSNRRLVVEFGVSVEEVARGRLLAPTPAGRHFRNQNVKAINTST